MKAANGLWVYRAVDEDGFVMAEAYSKARLIEKLWEEFGRADFKIIRYFDPTLR